MPLSGPSSRDAANRKALAAFGVQANGAGSGGVYRTIRHGDTTTVFTIGYEKRTGEELIAMLRDAGVQHLADIRDKPVSRKPDFRESALREFCAEAKIEYGAWSSLGSTEDQRERLHATGDLKKFHGEFRKHAQRALQDPLDQLAKVVQSKSVALLCYERSHDDCHRSTVADLLAERLNATVVAIV